MHEDFGEWKRLTRARLASERAGLLFVLLGISRETLQSEIVAEGLTAGDALFLIAAEDTVRANGIERTLRGDEGPLERAQPATGDLSRALTLLLESRAALLSALARVTDDLLVSRPDGSVAVWIEECRAHDRISTDRFAEWRAARIGVEDGEPPRDLLIAAMRAARKELLTEIALVPEEQRPVWSVGGRARSQTLSDALLDAVRHEWLTEQNVRCALGYPWSEEPVAPMDWQARWRQLHDIHHSLIRGLETMPEGLLNRPTATASRPYDFYRMQAARDRWLAGALRTGRDVTPLHGTGAP